MKNRIVAVLDIETVINDKMDFYKEWLDRGIINESEFRHRQEVLESVKSALFFRSVLSEEKEIA